MVYVRFPTGSKTIVHSVDWIELLLIIIII